MEIAEAVKYIAEKAEALERYSDNLRSAVYKIDLHLTPYFKEAGITYTAKEPFYVEQNIQFYLGIGKAKNGSWGILYKAESYGCELSDASRQKLKAAIPVLPNFLNEYAEVLNKKSEEYKTISEIAEAMQAVVEDALLQHAEIVLAEDS